MKMLSTPVPFALLRFRSVHRSLLPKGTGGLYRPRAFLVLQPVLQKGNKTGQRQQQNPATTCGPRRTAGAARCCWVLLLALTCFVAFLQHGQQHQKTLPGRTAIRCMHLHSRRFLSLGVGKRAAPSETHVCVCLKVLASTGMKEKESITTHVRTDLIIT